MSTSRSTRAMSQNTATCTHVSERGSEELPKTRVVDLRLRQRRRPPPLNVNITINARHVAKHGHLHTRQRERRRRGAEDPIAALRLRQQRRPPHLSVNITINARHVAKHGHLHTRQRERKRRGTEDQGRRSATAPAATTTALECQHHDQRAPCRKTRPLAHTSAREEAKSYRRPGSSICDCASSDDHRP